MSNEAPAERSPIALLRAALRGAVQPAEASPEPALTVKAFGEFMESPTRPFHHTDSMETISAAVWHHAMKLTRAALRELAEAPTPEQSVNAAVPSVIRGPAELRPTGASE